MPSPQTRRSIAFMLALFLVVVWGANYSLQKAIMGYVSPSALLFVRYIATPLCAVAVLVWSYGLQWPKLERRQWLTMMLVALLGQVMNASIITHAIHLSTAFSSALISALGPLFTLLIVRMTGQLRLTRVQTIGVGLALAGVLVFLSDKLGGVRAQSVGDLLLLLSAITFSAYTVVSGPLIDRLGVKVVLAYSTLLAAVPMLLMNAQGAWTADWASVPPLMWVGVFWSLVVASFAVWLIWGWLNAVLGVAQSAPLLYLLPPVAGAVSWVALGETFTPLKIAGAVLALVGVSAAQFGARTVTGVKDV